MIYYRIAISKQNFQRLQGIKLEIKDRHKEARHRPVSFNEVVGRLIEFWDNG